MRLEASWHPFGSHFGSQNRSEIDATMWHVKNLIFATPLQRNAWLCFPKRLPNRFKIVSETNFFQRGSWKLKKFKKVSKMSPTRVQLGLHLGFKMAPKSHPKRISTRNALENSLGPNFDSIFVPLSLHFCLQSRFQNASKSEAMQLWCFILDAMRNVFAMYKSTRVQECKSTRVQEYKSRHVHGGPGWSS